MTRAAAMPPPVAAQHPPAYRICERCIMDATDPEIHFDNQGFCNHCRQYDLVSHLLIKPRERTARLRELVERIKRSGRGKPYNCIVGVSGGTDSTYVAFLTHQLGLRPLAVHLDNGWDSELAVSNIEKTLKRLGIDLFTQVLDWEEFKSLQIAFLKASVPDIEIPTDHAIFSTLYHVAAKQRIRYIISGTNLTTECILPSSWAYGTDDWRYIKHVNKRYGDRRLRTYPRLTLLKRWHYLFIKRIQPVSILDYVQYDKQAAQQTITEQLGWRDYGGKHHESIYTRFLQNYILPRKFNVDKRRAHLSTLICSGQMTRRQALDEIKKLVASPESLDDDRKYVIKKLGLTEKQFDQIMAQPPRTHRDFPTRHPLIQFKRYLATFSALRKIVRWAIHKGVMPQRWM